MSITGAILNKSEVANPCGIIAYSYFNDFYSILYDNLTNISTITTEGINWASDINRLSITDASKMWLNTTLKNRWREISDPDQIRPARRSRRKGGSRKG